MIYTTDEILKDLEFFKIINTSNTAQYFIPLEEELRYFEDKKKK